LGIEVDRAELERWLGWYMPERQPYLVPRDLADGLGLEDQPELLTMELRDAFWIYGDQDDAVCWLDRAESRRLPSDVRRRREVRHRWRSTDLDADVALLVQHLEEGRRRSRHDEPGEDVWERSAAVLPDARRLAGTFPGRSGPNCFAMVMAAAGVAGAEDTWMVREPFEEWLAASSVRGGADDRAGTVMVWRSPDGLVQHAAVVLGDGYALHKPSQGWQSPTKVLTPHEVKMSSRAAGRRLHRYLLRSAAG
jgi:hypothetical protein